MHISVAASKINMWATRESGDTLEMVERPHGGLSFVLVDGQSSGPGAKALSLQVVRKVISDLAEGVRDGAVARAANDMLYTRRRGKVSAALVILSVELDSRRLLVTRCGNSPVFVRRPAGEVLELDALLEPGLLAVACTDGLVHAGSRSGSETLYVPEAIEDIWQGQPSAQAIASGLLERALDLDNGRAMDDISVIALHVQSGPPTGPRHMIVEMPVPDR